MEINTRVVKLCKPQASDYFQFTNIVANFVLEFEYLHVSGSKNNLFSNTKKLPINYINNKENSSTTFLL